MISQNLEVHGFFHVPVKRGCLFPILKSITNVIMDSIKRIVNYQTWAGGYGEPLRQRRLTATWEPLRKPCSCRIRTGVLLDDRQCSLINISFIRINDDTNDNIQDQILLKYNPEISTAGLRCGSDWKVVGRCGGWSRYNWGLQRPGKRRRCHLLSSSLSSLSLLSSLLS